LLNVLTRLAAFDPAKLLSSKRTQRSGILSGWSPSPPTSSFTVLRVSHQASKHSGVATDRTTGDLQAEGIIERTPSPVPLEERDPDELTPDELRELVRRSRAEKASAVKTKQEFKREKRTRESDSGTEDYAGGGVTIISENNKRKRAKESMENVEVIDLSDD
jgi:hypothetical protein